MAKKVSANANARHLFGSHVSVAGGLAKGVARAIDVGCDVIQVFTKNNNQWAAKPLVAADVDAWKTALAESGIRNPIAHASYLINLATPKDDLFQKSVDSLVMELERANELEIEGLVVHPGAFTTSNEADGIKRIIDAIVEILGRVQPGSCRLLLENTAGQGSCLGHQIHQLGAMIEGGGDSRRVGVCLDTCHAFAAGYEINTKKGFAAFRQELDDLLPAGSIAALHLNDSKKPLGSRVDRHEHIGRGEIGLDGFRHVLMDDKLGPVPGYLETEKGTDEETGEDWDRINLAVLRRLVAEIA
ncbi:deoxyribonuclease IV [Novipirellula sp.]|uniref:deoxyribonuclease IV n=1 Tax=Novipirellula sp. TaxID=2795430 RepID=UPI00356AA8C6